MNPNQCPFVSVIIPTYNEEKFIVGCLESLKHLDYPSDCYEVIVVDNGSADATVRLCEPFTPQVLMRPDLNVSGLRNDGAKHARGEIYAFLDADCTADVDWMRNAVESLAKDSCVTGSWYRASPEATWVESAWCSQVQEGRKEVSHINAGNLIVPADLFWKVGGFKESLKTGEDYEFCMRARTVAKIIADDTIQVVHHGNPKTVGTFFRRELWHGLGAFGTIGISLLDKPLLGTLSFCVLTPLQVIALMYLLFGGSPWVFFIITVFVIFLLMITIFYRRQYIRNISMAVHLLVLYYVYYLARSFSLILLVARIDYRRSR
jgi:glycosyltransferase involved in cell wall biosynthesis